MVKSKIGDVIFIHDGKGQIAKVHLSSITKREAFCNILESKTHKRQKPFIHLVQSMCQHIDLIIEKATEIGISSVHIVQTNKSACATISASKLEKLQYKSIVAMKQSAQPYMLNIEIHRDLASLSLHGEVLLLDQDGGNYLPNSDQDITYCVGPEGGLTSEEKQQYLAMGAKPYSLGSSILRCETAAICGGFLLKHLASK